MDGFVHSIQSFSTLDGPGIRAVVFLYGCPLRCIYCHNPDTWKTNGNEPVSPHTLVSKLLRFSPYIKSGGVTFSGGEPLMQAEFITECAHILHDHNMSVAIDTSGAVYNDSVECMLGVTDMVLLDIKFTNEEDYRKYTGGSLQKTMSFLEKLERRNIPVWIRHVVVPGLNDNRDDILELKKLTNKFSVVEKIDLLPFRKLCTSKYEELGIEFALKDTAELSDEKLKELEDVLKNAK